MISKTIGFFGVHYFQTNPYGCILYHIVVKNDIPTAYWSIFPTDQLQAVPEMDRLVSCCGDFAARRRAAVARAKVHTMAQQIT